jgi:hypothetical protein
VQKSKALTARIGELGRQRRWQDVLRAVETAESSGQKLDVVNYSAAIAALVRCQQPERASYHACSNKASDAIWSRTTTL